MMAFGGFSSHSNNQPMADINMIPLVDVMLVLLVIFMIASPLLTHAIRIDLPKAISHPELQKPEVINIAIDVHETVFWNEKPIALAALQRSMALTAQSTILPEVRIRADGSVAYRTVATVMSYAATAGLNNITFVTDPAMH